MPSVLAVCLDYSQCHNVVNISNVGASFAQYYIIDMKVRCDSYFKCGASYAQY